MIVRVHLAGSGYHYTPVAGGSSVSPDVFIIGAVHFEIDETRFERAIETGRRTTHAFAVGELVQVVDPENFDEVFVGFVWSPFAYERPSSGIFRLTDTGDAITGASFALFHRFPGGFDAWVSEPVLDDR